MGRELRRVPSGWKHPKDEDGNYKPMYAQYYGDAVADWINNHILWLDGRHPDQLEDPKVTKDIKFFADWDGDCPSIEYYNPNKWTPAIATCFQLYETVSEGSPVSRVMTLAQLKKWATKNGYKSNIQQVIDDQHLMVYQM